MIAEPSPQTQINARAQQLLGEQSDAAYRQTDRLFSGLLLLQWLAGIGVAFWISPKTWIGSTSQWHIHVWAAIFVGGTIAIPSAALGWFLPGRLFTRHVIAVAQMLASALLIDLTGGRIETHFHVFGSLAFLAFYFDWPVLITASVVVAADHFLRGIYFPASVYGTNIYYPWRWLEHSGWVAFEDAFLIYLCLRVRRSMAEIGHQQAELEASNDATQRAVTKRTEELAMANRDLVDASRRAGMAEVATSVLHNVGNVLNSVNVSATLVADELRQSQLSSLRKVSELLEEHRSDLGAFLSEDPRGRKVPAYVAALAEDLAIEQRTVLGEMENLEKNIGHIKDIVGMQQRYAKAFGVVETVSVSDLVDDALRMNDGGLARHEVELVRDYAAGPAITVEKHKVLQILVNLVRNAKYACAESGRPERRVTLKIEESPERVRISVADNGVGIPEENLTRIFSYGFTTRPEGHGFGLHSGALVARELGGNLTARSEGQGRGAVFTLELPTRPATAFA